MTEPRTTKFQSTKAYDVFAASPLVAFYVIGMVGMRPKFMADLQTHPAWLSDMRLAAHSAYVCYCALVVALVLVRRMPVAKSQGLWPRVIALLGANLLLVPPFLPGGSLSPTETAVSILLTGGGTATELLILLWLGRSFSILPEARRLVTRGPYSLIRHPLYLTSIIASIGTMLLFPNIWSVLVVLTADVLQVVRLHYEEPVLRSAFPEYAAYAARTWRILPGVY
jgi:protein-S-isoprenylcysteine O-methyltransferase Ste14